MKMRAIEIVELWNRFKGKFGWSTLQPEEIYLIPTVQPVTQIDDMLDSIVFKGTSNINVSATGNIVAITVPDGKKWTFLAIEAYLTGGTFTFGSIEIENVSGTLEVPLVLDPGVTQIITGPLSNITLDAGQKVIVNIDTFGAAGIFKMEAVVRQYDMS